MSEDTSYDSESQATVQVVLNQAIVGLGPAQALIEVAPGVADNLLTVGYARRPELDAADTDELEAANDAGEAPQAASVADSADGAPELGDQDSAVPAAEASLPAHSATKAEWVDAGRNLGLELDPEQHTKAELIEAVERQAAG